MSRLAITCGDPAGVGPEIIQAWLAQHPERAARTAVIGPGRWLERIDLVGALAVPVGDAEFSADPGRPSVAGARVAWAAMKRAADGVVNGDYTGVVTGPVSKGWLQQAGYPFPGQTEFFANVWGGEPTMGFCGGKLAVVLLTWHIPLREVPQHLTLAEFARTVAAAAEMVAAAKAGGHVGPTVRIGVCGLNPHAGEGGMLGREEMDTIEPILADLRAKYAGLSRCEPADTLFARQLAGEFDVVIALYHDQGLAPLKTVDFEEAVNVTLGLPHVRTSPDHGTAFSIAGQGKASLRSFARAVEVADSLIRWRQEQRK